MEITPKGFEQKRDSISQAELDAPVDAYVPKEEVEETVTEEIVEEPVVEEDPEPEVIEEEKVPKSRLLTVLEKKRVAEESVSALEARLAVLEQGHKATEESEIDLPSEWIGMYGDSDESKNFYKNYLNQLSTIEEKAAERAIERMQSKAKESEQIETEIATSLNTQFEELAEIEGKEIPEEDQVAILEIVEEYSPKDADGKIVKEYMTSVSKAHGIWKLKKEAALVSRRKARSQAVVLTSTKTEGETSANNSAEFVPGKRGQWETKLPT